MNVYIAQGEEASGPYSVEQVRRFLAEGSVLPADLGWHEGLADWIPVSELTGQPTVQEPVPVLSSPEEIVAHAVPPPSRSIFISYRREDSEANTGRIYDRLIQKFNSETIFKDVDTIPMGVDFREHLNREVAGCRVQLVVVGKQWADNPRLQDEGDLVRIEVEYGLDPAHGILVVPVLVGNTSMPSSDQLPPSLNDFVFRNAIQVRPDPDFHRDMDKLIKSLMEVFGDPPNDFALPPPSEEIIVVKPSPECPETWEGINLVPGGKFQEYTLLKPLEVASGEADLWFIADTEGNEHVLKLYRYGIKPVEKIAKWIRSMEHEFVVKVETAGEVVGRHYEILEKIEHGNLDDYVGGKRVGENQLKEILQELGGAVAHVHEAGIIHGDIKPANILVRKIEPLNLVLADFPSSNTTEEIKSVSASVSYTPLYSAPEAYEGQWTEGRDWWCVGVILLKLFMGKDPFEGLTEREVVFKLMTEGIRVPESVPADWQLLFKGLLTRNPENRWAWNEVEKWLGGSRDIATQYEGDQKEKKNYQHLPYKFNGKEHYTAMELAVSLGGNWEAGKKDLERGMILKWVEGQLADQDLTRHFYDITEDERLDGDEQLSVALMAMANDRPVLWKGDVLSPDWLKNNPEAAAEIKQSRLMYYFGLYHGTEGLYWSEAGLEDFWEDLPSPPDDEIDVVL